MNEKRIEERYRLNETIIVRDSLKECEIGDLVNIHQNGLMIMGKALTPNASYQITLALPKAIEYSEGKTQNIALGIECLWQQQTDLQADIFWSGCSIIDVSPIAKECIHRLIESQ